MSDHRIRELERQVRRGAPGAREQLIYARIRAGFIPIERVTLAARAGDVVCAQHLGIEPIPEAGKIYHLARFLFAWSGHRPWYAVLLMLVNRVHLLPAIWEDGVNAQERLQQAVVWAERWFASGTGDDRNRLNSALYGLPNVWPVEVLRMIGRNLTNQMAAPYMDRPTVRDQLVEGPFRSLAQHWGTAYGFCKGPAEAERQIAELVAARAIRWALDCER